MHSCLLIQQNGNVDIVAIQQGKWMGGGQTNLISKLQSKRNLPNGVVIARDFTYERVLVKNPHGSEVEEFI